MFNFFKKLKINFAICYSSKNITNILKKGSFNLDKLLDTKNGKKISLIEKAFFVDVDNLDCFCTQQIFDFVFNQNIDKQEILNHQFSNGLSFIESAFYYENAIEILKYLLDFKIVQGNEYYIPSSALMNKRSEFKKDKCYIFPNDTCYFFIAFFNNNIKAIQHFYNLEQKNTHNVFNHTNSEGNGLLSYILQHCDLRTFSFCLERINQIYKQNKIGANQIEQCFLILKQKTVQCLPFHKDEVNLYVSNLIKVITFYNFNIIKNSMKIIFDGMKERNDFFVEILFNRFCLNLSYIDRHGYAFIDYLAQEMDFEAIKKLKEKERLYQQNYSNLPDSRKGRGYIDFLSIPLLRSNETFNAQQYIEFFKKCVIEFKLDVHKLNKYGNNHIHTICLVMDKNPEQFLEVLRFFLEECKINPYIYNVRSELPIRFVRDFKTSNKTYALIKEKSCHPYGFYPVIYK